MSQPIRRLPEALANQIAAGEVVQRPASVLKELIENAIDAGATDVQVHLRDSGKTLIQVIDNGHGMGPEDALLSFERHATSKIRSLDDLFSLRSYGFRGEALAATAAVAQVEMRTRRSADEIGTLIRIEGGQLKLQEPAPASVGTSIQVKNLFYNVPARRNFLKSDETELRNLIDAFQQMALARPDLQFRLSHQGTDVYNLRPGHLRQRITSLFGESMAGGMVPIQESTPILEISGFVGRPGIARKSRGLNFFFLNGRFIRHPYLHHAVVKGFNELLPEGSHPSYLIFLSVDPGRVDVNVHPAKTEVKFDDEKTQYAILMAAVRRSLSQYQVAQTIDFDIDSGLEWTAGLAKRASEGAHSGVSSALPDASPASGSQLRSPFNPSYNPFDSGNRPPRPVNDSWRRLMELNLPQNSQNVPGLFPADERDPTRNGATNQPQADNHPGMNGQTSWVEGVGTAGRDWTEGVHSAPPGAWETDSRSNPTSPDGRVDAGAPGGGFDSESFDGRVGIGAPGGNSGFGSPDGRVDAGAPGGNSGFRSPDGRVDAGAPGGNSGFRSPDGRVHAGAPGGNSGFRSPDGRVDAEAPGGNSGFGLTGGRVDAGAPGGNSGFGSTGGRVGIGAHGGNSASGSTGGRVDAGAPGGNSGFGSTGGRVDSGTTGEVGLFQLHGRYVVGTLRSGLLVIDQEAAHYRILFDRFRARLISGSGASQQCIFPARLALRQDEQMSLSRLRSILHAAGFDWTEADAAGDILLTGLPADLDLPEPEQLFHSLLSDEYPTTGDALASIREQLSRIMARKSHIRAGKHLSISQMRQLVDELFACENPYYNPDGRPVLLTITIPEIQQRLGGTV